MPHALPPTKACPVVLRPGHSTLEILAFAHPLGGLQLVKGSIEASEDSAHAAVRELLEESGLHASATTTPLGLWVSGHLEQVWALHRCHIPQLTQLPPSWVHHTADGGGLDFRFFWHPLHAPHSADSHPVFQRALRHIAEMFPR